MTTYDSWKLRSPDDERSDEYSDQPENEEEMTDSEMRSQAYRIMRFVQNPLAGPSECIEFIVGILQLAAETGSGTESEEQMAGKGGMK